MWLNVTHVGELKLTIWDLLETCSLGIFLSGSGKTYVWTSLWVYPAPLLGMTLYGSLWIAWPSRPISYPYAPDTGPDTTLSYTSPTLLAIMVYRRHHLWPRIHLCRMFLGTIAWLPWYPSHSQLSLSPSDWRSNRESESDHGGYASCMCSKWWPEVRSTSAPSRVLLQ
jgi:hypothetical protein